MKRMVVGCPENSYDFKTLNFEYNGNEIPFKVDERGEVFMNATEMAKPFEGKRINNFLRRKDLLEYVNALHEEKSIALISAIGESPLIQTIRGRGEDMGTINALHEEKSDVRILTSTDYQ